jgi:pyridoxal phosphate enzyme (YggS family)
MSIELIRRNIEHISSIANLNNIRLVAVTKTQNVQTVRDAFTAGIKIMGENRVQEASEKANQLENLAVEWHLIGHLQTNKVKQAVSLFSLIHSVDSIHLAEEIDKRAHIMGKVQNILLQVNVSKEATKNGIDIADLPSLVRVVNEASHLNLCGLMTIAPLVADPEQARPVFRETRRLFDIIKTEHNLGKDFQWLSMGMSMDYTVAVEEGANMIRLGTALFGARI